MTSDPRIEALTRYIDGDLGFAAMSPRIRAEELRVSAGMLAHVDAADRAAGVVRVDTTDSAVMERLTFVVGVTMLQRGPYEIALAVLAALLDAP